MNTQANRLDYARRAGDYVRSMLTTGGGDMEEILRRLGAVETRLGAVETRLGAVETDVSGVKAQLPYLAAKSDVSDAKTSIIQWMIGSTLAVASLAFVIAKFVH